jgi:hypothetical protein
MRTILTATAFAVAFACGCETKKKVKPTTKATEANRSSGGGGGGGGGSSSGGSGGAVQAVRGAVKRIVDQNEMRNIHLFIENASGASGRMPSVNDTYAAIKKEAPKTAEKIDDGIITLCNARMREDIWAYETDALQNGGWVCSSSGVERMDAQTLKQRLGK